MRLTVLALALAAVFSCATQTPYHRVFSQQAAEHLAIAFNACRIGVHLTVSGHIVGVSSRQQGDLQDGDLVQSIDGFPPRPDQSAANLRSRSVGEPVVVVVERHGRTMDIETTCIDREESRKVAAAASRGDWQECYRAVSHLEAMEGATSDAASLRLACYRASLSEDGKPYGGLSHAKLGYEYARRLIKESRFSADDLAGNRGTVLSQIDWLKENGHSSFASDVRAQLDSASQDMRGSNPEPARVTKRSTGTCFAVGAPGTVATAYHVVEDATEYRVRFAGDEEPRSARPVAVSGATDLAILAVAGSTPKPLQVALLPAKIGQPVFTIGHPVPSLLGSEAKFTEGSVSALSGLDDATYLQISVPIQPGNSGGPLLAEDGSVVGVVVASAAIRAFVNQTGTLPQSVNFAVKGDYLRPLLATSTAPQSVSRANAIQRAEEAVCVIEAWSE